MALPRLTLACVAVLIAMTASDAAAATCPADQKFTGTLTGDAITFSITTAVRGSTSFQIIPDNCQLPSGSQSISLSVWGVSLSGNCSVGITFANAAARTWTVVVNGEYLNHDGLAYIPFTLIEHQTRC